MDLADSGGGIARAAEVAEDIGQAAWILSTETVVAVVVAILAGEEGDAAGGADGVLGVGVGEGDAARDERVDGFGVDV